jgi:polyhydroxyalkanoate synthesis regulator phasin
MFKDYETVDKENKFDELQDIMKEILQKEFKVSKQESEKFVEDLIKDNKNTVKEIFDDNDKSLEETSYDLINLFFNKTKINQKFTNKTNNNTLIGERDLNKNEKRLLKFWDFVNENRK